MLLTTAAARLSRATITRRGFTSTSALNGVPTVHYDHFASGWNENDEPYTEGKFHIETFNKISPLVRVYMNIIWWCVYLAAYEYKKYNEMSDLITWLSICHFIHGRCLTYNKLRDTVSAERLSILDIDYLRNYYLATSCFAMVNFFVQCTSS